MGPQYPQIKDKEINLALLYPFLPIADLLRHNLCFWDIHWRQFEYVYSLCGGCGHHFGAQNRNEVVVECRVESLFKEDRTLWKVVRGESQKSFRLYFYFFVDSSQSSNGQCYRRMKFDWCYAVLSVAYMGTQERSSQSQRTRTPIE